MYSFNSQNNFNFSFQNNNEILNFNGNDTPDEENPLFENFSFPLFEFEQQIDISTEKKEIIKWDYSLNFPFKNEQINVNISLQKETQFTLFVTGNQSSNLKDNLKTKENNGIISEIISKDNQDKQAKKLGRKRKSNSTRSIHSKNDEDNKMIKIKTCFGNNLHNFINSFLEQGEKLKKLEPKIHEIIKKDFNLRIWDSSLKEIYLTTNTIKRNKKEKDKNKEIIKKIYENENNNYHNIIQIINLTYGEAFQIFIRNIKPINLELTNKILGLDDLIFSKFPEAKDVFNQIIKKERNKKTKKESEEFIENYIFGKKGIKELCLNFKDWFNRKKGRNRIKKSMSNSINNKK